MLFRSEIEVPAEYRAGYAQVAKRYGFEVETGPTPADDPQLAAAVAELRKRIK